MKILQALGTVVLLELDLGWAVPRAGPQDMSWLRPSGPTPWASHPGSEQL